MKKTVLILALILLSGRPVAGKVVDRIVAQVNDDIITLSDLRRAMADVRTELASRFAGEQLEKEISKAEKEVLEDLIRQKLILQKANELGFSSNVDAQVSATLQDILKRNNLKDVQELEAVLARQGMTLTSFREQIRSNLIVQGLVGEFVGSRITLLTQDIEKYYKEHAAEYSTPEEVTLSEIIIPVEGNAAEAEARANDVYKRIQQGEAFPALASQYSKGATAGRGGGIGSYLTAKLNPEIAQSIANVKEGDVTKVLRAKEGLVIYRVDSRKTASLRPLEEVRDEIRNRIWQQKFNPEYDRFVAQLKEDAYIQIFAETPAK